MKTKVIMGMLTLLLVGGGYWGLNAAEQLTSDGVTIASNNSSEKDYRSAYSGKSKMKSLLSVF